MNIARARALTLALTSITLFAIALVTPALAAWPPEGTVVNGMSHTYESAGLDPAPNGGFAVSATTTNNATYPVVVGHVANDGTGSTGSGFVGWESRSLPAPDGQGGYFIAGQASFGGTTSTFRVLHRRADDTWDPAFGSENGLLLWSDVILFDVRTPALYADGAGGVLAIAERYGSTAVTRGTFVQHFDASGAVVAGWPAGGRRLTSDYTNAGTFAVVPDGGGGAFALVSTQYGPATGSVDLYHVLANGALDPSWGGVYSVGPYYWESTGTNVAFLLSHGTSATLVYKTPGVSTSEELAAFRFDATLPTDGAIWSETLLAGTGGRQTQAFADGASGVYAFWAVDSPGRDVMGAHVRSDGSFASPTRLHGGSALPAGALFGWLGAGATFAAGPDGADGAVIAWKDFRDAKDSMYVSPLLADGSVPFTWPAGGALVPVDAGLCLIGPHDHGRPRAARGDGAGHAFVVWEVGNYQCNPLRLARVDSPLVLGAPLGTRTLALTSPVPNPARHDAGVSLELTVRTTGYVRVRVHDVAGRVVSTLIDDSIVHAAFGSQGPFTLPLRWDARDAVGHRVSPGVYLVRAEYDGQVVTRRVSVLP